MSTTHSSPAKRSDEDDVAAETWALQKQGYYAGSAAQMRMRGKTAKRRAEATERLIPALREQQRLQLDYVDICQKLSVLDAERCHVSDRSIFDEVTEAWLSRAQSLLHKTEARRFALPDELSADLIREGKTVLKQFAIFVRNIDVHQVQGKERKANKKQRPANTANEIPKASINEAPPEQGDKTDVFAETFDVYVPHSADRENESTPYLENNASPTQGDKEEVISVPFNVYAPRVDDVYGSAPDITLSEPKQAGYNDYIVARVSEKEKTLNKETKIKLSPKITLFTHPLTLVRAGEWKNLRRCWPHSAENWTIKELWFDPEDGPAALAIPQGGAPKLVRLFKRRVDGKGEAVLDAIETPTLDARFLDDPKHLDKRSLSFVTITAESDVRDEVGLRFFIKRCHQLSGDAIICTSNKSKLQKVAQIINSNRFRGKTTEKISEVSGSEHICVVDADSYDFSIINKLENIFTLTLIGSHAQYPDEERALGLDRHYRRLSAFDWGALLGAERFLISS
jgi:hypothetical protein